MTRKNRAVAAVFWAAALWILANRLHTYEQPVQVDIGAYAAVGHGLLHGQRFYTDLWDFKPPLIYGVYAAVEKLVGYGQQQVFVLGLIAALLTLVGVYWAAVWLQGSSASGLWAAGFWALRCNDLRLEANAPNCEVFLNALAVWGVAMYARQRTSRDSNRFLIGAASGFGIP